MSGTTMESVQQPTPQPLPTPPSLPNQADWVGYYASVVTEDDEPVDNLFSEKQQRLLAESLYNAWTPPLGKKQAPDTKRLFLAAANVGLFYAKSQPPLVPDLFISLDVQPHANWYAKEHRSYFVWEFGKLPEVVVEIVSNSEGGELSRNFDTYAEIGVTYYVVYDPQQRLSEQVLQVFALRDGEYQLLEQPHLPRVGLRLLLWDGVFDTPTHGYAGAMRMDVCY
jgi:Uma2 family endonuclease